jgi:hypothetical protein
VTREGVAEAVDAALEFRRGDVARDRVVHGPARSHRHRRQSPPRPTFRAARSWQCARDRPRLHPRR